MIKLLTGQAIHDALVEVQGMDQKDFFTWDELPISTKNEFTQIAKRLNQDLGLCEECGERPIAPNVLLEVAGDNICSDCCNPPVDEHDPNVQHMHFVTNPDGTLAGVLVPPAGMSLEEYKAIRTEEMKDIHFLLTYWDTDGNICGLGADDIPGLVEQMKQIPIATMDKSYEYSIQVMKKVEKIGHGHYLRTWDEVKIQSETGAAEGLNDALYEYVFTHV